MSDFSYSDRRNLWINAGGSPIFADLAAAISMAENVAGDPLVISPAGDVGLWQINIPWHPQYTVEQLQNPLENAKAAIAISSNGSDWSPWVTYKNHSYQQYLQGSSGSVALLSSGGCNTVTIPMPSLPGFSSSDLCLDGPIGLLSIGAGLLLAVSAILILVAFTLKDTSIGRQATKLTPVGKLVSR